MISGDFNYMPAIKSIRKKFQVVVNRFEDEAPTDTAICRLVYTGLKVRQVDGVIRDTETTRHLRVSDNFTSF